ncbi:hypothetical protein JTB14_007381 [Gonioctena quinquepunctata]|nr:hypothetical protein JTB14_007381 [Gonioctena quinquepunctata]
MCLLLVIFLVQLVDSTHGCNEALCGPVVSKCLLTQSCKCDLKQNETCILLCFNCLGALYTECCNCLDMCPKTIDELAELNRQSYVEDLMYPVPQLFEVLVEKPELQDTLKGWTSEKFLNKPISKNTAVGTGKMEAILNCSVAFWIQCMSYEKCKVSCTSMGASRFRLFHDGCCECVGETCINYGIGVSRCQMCPWDDGLLITEDENELDYGDDNYFGDAIEGDH